MYNRSYYNDICKYQMYISNDPEYACIRVDTPYKYMSILFCERTYMHISQFKNTGLYVHTLHDEARREIRFCMALQLRRRMR